MDTRQYDVVVIGAGPTGENVADRAVKGGLRTTIIESELVGGECSYWACIPSKALLQPILANAAARSVAGALRNPDANLDVSAVLTRRDAFTSNWKDAGQVKWLEQSNIELVRGHARLAGEHKVRVTDKTGKVIELVPRHAIAICTGTRAAIPPIPGLAESRPWTSREATSARKAPRRLVILGGGVVACEMATAWRHLGSDSVTMILRGSRLLANCEPFAGDMLRESLERSAVAVLTNTSIERVERGADGVVQVTLGGGKTISADEILVAAGREPRTDDLGLETVGLKPGSWLDVDDSMQVKNVTGDWLYAVGDVNHRALLTHMGKYQARACGDVIAARASNQPDAIAPKPWTRYVATADNQAVPQVIFTMPEVATVGLSEAQARARRMNVQVVEYDIGRVAGASLQADNYSGRAKMVVDRNRQVLVGVTLVGAGVGDLIHAATIAIVAGVPIDRLWHAVPAYPTVSEIWLRLLETLRSEDDSAGGKPITALVKTG
jgi:pyruvate/2-oxoglutarate dehydrogenase complex dihydrolipoamide dehydrogenase (E3) component